MALHVRNKHGWSGEKFACHHWEQPHAMWGRQCGPAHKLAHQRRPPVAHAVREPLPKHHLAEQQARQASRALQVSGQCLDGARGE